MKLLETVHEQIHQQIGSISDILCLMGINTSDIVPFEALECARHILTRNIIFKVTIAGSSGNWTTLSGMG